MRPPVPSYGGRARCVEWCGFSCGLPETWLLSGARIHSLYQIHISGHPMPQEIERKFLVNRHKWPSVNGGEIIRQGYLNSTKERIVRVRTCGTQAWLTIKGITTGATRAEYEYTIPIEDAQQMLDHLCERPLIEKVRHAVRVGQHNWEVDEFRGDNAGLLVAEIELAHEAETFERPEWLGEEVTHDARYFNSNLLARPYGSWSDPE